MGKFGKLCRGCVWFGEERCACPHGRVVTYGKEINSCTGFKDSKVTS